MPRQAQHEENEKDLVLSLSKDDGFTPKKTRGLG